MNILSWENLIFLIPLSISMIIGLGSAIGVVDFDIDADIDADIDTDGDIHSVFESTKGFLELFGFGKVPFSIIMMTVTMLFGIIGVCSNIVLEPIFKVPLIYGLISLGLSSIGTITLTGIICRFIGKHMPTTETSIKSAFSLQGLEGNAYTDISKTFGVAQVRDRNSVLQKIPCRTYDGEIASGQKILVTEYDEKSKVYKVDLYLE